MKDFLVDLGQGFLSVHYDSISYSNQKQKIKQILKNKSFSKKWFLDTHDNL